MTRILIADDHALIRAGLKEILAAQPNMHVIEAQNGQELLRKLATLDIHVIVLDISMPGRSGLDILKEIKSSFPMIPVLMLSVYPEDQYALRALKAGASGYLTKDSAPEKLVSAIERVLAGEKYISSSIANKLISELGLGNINKLPHEDLSDREFEVLRLIGSGMAVSEIAEKLYLSPKTISTYRSRVLEKTGLKNNAGMINYVIEYDLKTE
ncbi:MAG TPA: response regulator transcription factor [Flavobacteriales bacterium]|nr:response regulator transcription factor [Flavobacteriales bacterium]